MWADLGGYIASPIIYLAVYEHCGAPADPARLIALLLFELHFGDTLDRPSAQT